MRQTFKIKDILPNPFRHIEHYPIKRAKVDALKESIESTGFWDNIVARPKNGKVEIAYGHHRLAALKEFYGPNEDINLIVRKLDDSTMLKMMARENMEEWGTSVVVEHETIRAVVEAYAEGRIELPGLPPKLSESQLRHAPSFAPGSPPAAGGLPYTAQMIADFIGWLKPDGRPQDKVFDALTALYFIEEGILKVSDFEGLTTTQAQAVVQEARRVIERRKAEARRHREQAERAEREAQEAAKQREAAEKARKEKEAEAAKAAKAKDEVAKRRAKLEAERFKQERAEAAQREREAARREKAAREKEKAAVEEGRRRAAKVGRVVSEKIRSGEIGRREAPRVAREIDKPKKGERVVWAQRVAREVATKINRILDPERDPRAEEVEELIRLRDALDEATRENLARNLDIVSGRAADYAQRLRGETSKPGRLPSGEAGQ